MNDKSFPKWMETQKTILKTMIDAIDHDDVLSAKMDPGDATFIATYLLINQQLHMLKCAVENATTSVQDTIKEVLK